MRYSLTFFSFFFFLFSFFPVRSSISDIRIHDITKGILDLDIDMEMPLLEGYSSSISGQVLTYHSALPEAMEALLCRATDGTMEITWKTDPVIDPGPGVNIVWLAGLGANLGEHRFDLYVNSEEYLTFASSRERRWSVNGKDGSSLTFIASYVDQVGDLFGIMLLRLNTSGFAGNAPLHLSVKGRKEMSDAWYMTFKYEHTGSMLRKTLDDGFWYCLKENVNNQDVILELPRTWSGRTAQIGDHALLKLKPGTNTSGSHFPAVWLDQGPVAVVVGERFIDSLRLPAPGAAETDIYDNGKFVLRTVLKKDGVRMLEVSGSYTSRFTDKLEEVSRSPYANGTLELITSSHQDIAWMDNPEACKIKRDTLILTPAMNLLRTDTTYKYSAEQALMLYEYLDRHPDLLDEVRRFSAQGRLEWGASFNQPYEGMYYGESLVRQFYLGRKWLKKILPGYDPKVYFNIDVPGRTRQMPQIAKKSGVDFMIISRHEPGYFYWMSPDSSKIAVHSPGHYHHASEFLRQPVQTTMIQTPDRILALAEEAAKYGFPGLLPVLYSSDMSAPADMRDLFQAWNNIRIISAETSSTVRPQLPKWRYNIFQPVMETLFSEGRNIPVISGERPNVWLYIHGPTHHWAISASREGGRLLPVAETFSTIAAVLNNNWEMYPEEELDRAWEAQIFPDHGWGGQDGHITDQLFWDKAEYSRSEAHRLIDNALQQIAPFIKTEGAKGKSLNVFNPLSWQRDALLKTSVRFEKGDFFNIAVHDMNGEPVKFAITKLERFKDGSIKSAELISDVKQLPSLGYKTLYFTDPGGYGIPADKKRVDPAGYFENAFYTIEFDPGGVRRLYDRQRKMELADTEKFLFGELVALKSEGNGAGEFAEPQLPTTEYFERMSDYEPVWKQTASNDLFTTFEFRQEMQNSTVVEKLIIYHTVKRIDVEIDVLEWDGTRNREYRLMFPLNQEKAEISYDVPFAKVTVGEDELPGAAGERYVQPAGDVHPREVLDWISSSDRNSGVTFSSDVAVWDYLDPTPDPVDYPVLQPVLLASRKSCHWLGNWYLQEGDHHYRFSFTSHEPGWERGYRFAREANMPVFSIAGSGGLPLSTLPESRSFLAVDRGNILLSTLKKAEDSDAMIVRFYEAEGKDTDFHIRMFIPFTRMEKTNLIEEPVKADPEPARKTGFKIGKFAVETWKLIP